MAMDPRSRAGSRTPIAPGTASHFAVALSLASALAACLLTACAHVEQDSTGNEETADRTVPAGSTSAQSHSGSSAPVLPPPRPRTPLLDPAAPDAETPPTESPPAAPAVQELEALIAQTRHPLWKTRWDAVSELGNRKDPRAIPALSERSLRDDNPHPRWRSLWAVASIDHKGGAAIPAFIEALNEEDPIVVRNAAVALAFFGRPEARPELLRGLEDPEEFRRWEAVFSLRKVPNNVVAERLIHHLDPSNEHAVRVRNESALSLGRIGGRKAVEPLLRALREDPSHQVRWRAAMALAQLRDPSALDGLEQALASEQNDEVRKHIRDAIKKLK